MGSDMRDSIYFCDLSHLSFRKFYNADVFPWGIGCIAAFLLKNAGQQPDVRLFRYPHKLSEALVEHVPSVVAFANYMWNFHISCCYAKFIKELSPNTVVVFGGPNYPVDPNEQARFLKSHPYIDFYIEGEGELAFLELYQALVTSNYDLGEVRSRPRRSCNFVHRDSLVKGEKVPRIKDLAEIPSPYLTGLFDNFFDGTLRPLMQTNRGCPFGCTFCVEGDAYYSKVNNRPLNVFEQELEYIAQRLPSKGDLFIADSNFGMFQRDLEFAQAIARTQAKHEWPLHISVATGKNSVERVLKVAEIVDGSMRISAAVQSLDSQVLANIKRSNINTDEIQEVARQADRSGANTLSEIILALPGDSKDAHFRTVESIVNSGVNVIASHTLMMLPGTECNTPETRARFGMKTKFRLVSRSAGRYTIGEREFTAAEIEEVCVGGNALPFEAYLECRVLALTLTIFYNDCVADEALKVLRAYEIPNWSYIQAIHEGYYARRLPAGLLELYDNFARETQDELWDDPEKLRESLDLPGQIDRLNRGERGHNIIFKHKAWALTRCLPEIHEVAFETVGLLISPNIEERDLREFIRFLDQLKTYSLLRKKDFLTDHDRQTMNVDFDMIQAERNEWRGNFKTYLLSDPEAIEFYQDERQIAHIERQAERLGGKEEVSISQLLMLVPSKKLFRKTNYQKDV